MKRFFKFFIFCLSFLFLSQSLFCQEEENLDSASTKEINLYDLQSAEVKEENLSEQNSQDNLITSQNSSESQTSNTDDIADIDTIEEDENSQTDQNSLLEDQSEEDTSESLGGIATVPDKKRPKPIDKKKAEEAREKDESKEDEENNRKIIKYGLPSEIGELLDKLTENDDPRFTDDIYDLFQNTSNASIKEKVLKYFTKIEDPCLEDFAVNLINDPYDEKKDLVSATFKYIQTVKTKEALPAVITILEVENEDYFNDALATIGEIGSKKEAKFIADYLDRPDLSDAQRQTLMRTLGKMKALNTWSKVVEILEDEDENSFVRMYAAEALGLMEKEEGVPVLVRAYSASDPNLRQYVIKGLSHFPNVVESKSLIIQAIRDEHWRVRQEAINVCKENSFTEAIPYLIFRADKDSEKVIKNASMDAIAAINTKEGNDYLVSIITNKKSGDSSKQKAAEVLLKAGNAGQNEIMELAESCVDDDKKKNLRYSIGKELAKNSRPEFEKICSLYLASKDTTTIGIGLDMYKNCRFSSVEEQMRTIEKDKKANSSIKNRIRKMLNIEETEDESEKKSK